MNLVEKNLALKKLKNTVFAKFARFGHHMDTNLHNSTVFYEKSEPCFFREFLKFVIFAIFSSKIAIFQLF